VARRRRPAAPHERHAGVVYVGTGEQPIEHRCQHALEIRSEVQTLGEQRLSLTGPLEDQHVVATLERRCDVHPTRLRGRVVPTGEHERGPRPGGVVGGAEVPSERRGPVGDPDGFDALLHQLDGGPEGGDVAAVRLLQTCVVEIGADEVVRLSEVLTGPQECVAGRDPRPGLQGRLPRPGRHCGAVEPRLVPRTAVEWVDPTRRRQGFTQIGPVHGGGRQGAYELTVIGRVLEVDRGRICHLSRFVVAVSEAR
jgi:hypothetical protein